MKLLSLNVWAGIRFEPLLQFISRYAAEVDVFCFQEVFSTATDHLQSGESRVNLFQEMQSALTGFNGFFDGAQDGIDMQGAVDFQISYGLATFVKRGVSIADHGDLMVYATRNGKDVKTGVTVPRNLQYLRLNISGKQLTIANLHGLWNGGGKGDDNDRLEQSRLTVDFLNGEPGDTILCGDFNLWPDTESMKLLEQGRRNLIKDYGIFSTRSELYTKENKFADYILVSDHVTVSYFQVLPDVVSDHLAMLLDFS